MNRFSLVLAVLILVHTINRSFAQTKIENESNQYVQLSMRLVNAVKEKQDYKPFLKEMEQLSLNQLAESLDSDNKTKAFWINTYNAYVQILLKENPSLFDDRGSFFKADQINVGGELMSFDFIEHGIIRGSKVKLSMGFLKDPFASSLEKQFRVEETDGRIHFALNCGATSCPYVAIYSAYNLDQELDLIAKQFLEKTTTYNESNYTVNVTTLFNWFKGDFSSKDGVLGYLKYYKIIPESADPKVNYDDYDWTLDLGNFTELSR